MATVGDPAATAAPAAAPRGAFSGPTSPVEAVLAVPVDPLGEAKVSPQTAVVLAGGCPTTTRSGSESTRSTPPSAATAAARSSSGRCVVLAVVALAVWKAPAPANMWRASEMALSRIRACLQSEDGLLGFLLVRRGVRLTRRPSGLLW